MTKPHRSSLDALAWNLPSRTRLNQSRPQQAKPLDPLPFDLAHDQDSVRRPIHLLFIEPIVFFFSLWVSFSWAVLYATFAAMPLVFRESYDSNVEQCGAVFGAMCIASILSTVLSILQDKCVRQYLARISSLWKPERHLYVSCVQSLLLPIGCFWFG
jgi:hypothetical protein